VHGSQRGIPKTAAFYVGQGRELVEGSNTCIASQIAGPDTRYSVSQDDRASCVNIQSKARREGELDRAGTTPTKKKKKKKTQQRKPEMVGRFEMDERRQGRQACSTRLDLIVRFVCRP